MQTRCPHCRTVYSVEGHLVEELDARVRCGACMTLFNARDCLLADALAEAVAEGEDQAGAAQQAADAGEWTQTPLSGDDIQPSMTAQPTLEPDPHSESQPERLPASSSMEETPSAAESRGDVFEVGDGAPPAPDYSSRHSAFPGEASSDASDVGDMTAEIDWPKLDLPDPEFAGGNYGPPAPKAQVPLPAAAEPDALEALKERAAAAVEEVSSSQRHSDSQPAESQPTSSEETPTAAEVPVGEADAEQVADSQPVASDVGNTQAESTDAGATSTEAAEDGPASLSSATADSAAQDGPGQTESAASEPQVERAAESPNPGAAAEGRDEPGLHDLLLEEELAAARDASAGRRGWLWALGALLLLLASIGQLLFWQRAALAGNPGTRSLVVAMCGVLGCELEPLRDVERIELLQRSVYSHPNAAGALIISVSMVNNAGFAQPYPTLAIRMADVRGRTVAARDFAAGDYLKPGEGSDSMPIGAPVTITLEVLDPGRDALTFELDFL